MGTSSVIERVMARISANRIRTVTVRPAMDLARRREVTRSMTLDVPICATAMVAEIAQTLVRDALAEHAREKIITLLAVSVSHLGEQPVLQLELPLGLADEPQRPGARQGVARLTADRAMDAVRTRFGRDALGYAVVSLSDGRSVPDAFRELAEKDLR